MKSVEIKPLLLDVRSIPYALIMKSLRSCARTIQINHLN
jgi:hypothetical protein